MEERLSQAEGKQAKRREEAERRNNTPKQEHIAALWHPPG